MPTTERIEFENGDGATLAGRLELPEGPPRAVALFAHCFTCGKDVAAATRLARGLAARGYAVLRFDFTGLGNSDGDFANTNFSSNVRDLVAAADHLRGTVGAPRLLVGHSLGGAAVLVAARDVPECTAVATIAAPADPSHVRRLLAGAEGELERTGEATVRLGEREFRVRKQLLDDLETRAGAPQLADLRRALLVLHSPIDNVVSIDDAAAIFSAAKHPKSFVSLDDADHLLSRRADSEYAASVLAAWAARFVDAADAPAAPAPPEGAVVVERVAGLHNRVRTGRHVLDADEPLDKGGTDRGPDPYDYLLAALGACTSMTLELYARRKGWPLDGVRVTLANERVHARDCEDCESTEGFADVLTRELAIDGALDADQRARLLEIADKCPVHRTLTENEIRVRTRAAPPGG